MDKLNHKPFETMKRKNGSIKTRWMLLVLALVAAFVILPSILGRQVALADNGGRGGHIVDVTFTKWITTPPNMAGVVGGEVGPGTFAGEIINRVPGPEITRIEALYHINGSLHSFTAHLFVTQNEVKRTAVLIGWVTDGWLKGKFVLGFYKIISCPDKTGGRCFQGTLHIPVGF